jgi:GT2 family glycosyltransferase
MISIIVLTHNRVHLLRKCVDQTLARTSQTTQEIIIWDNGSTDGTREYLDSVVDPRIKIVHSPENIAHNAKPRAIAMTSGEYLLELDDDVIDAPAGWDETLLAAYRSLPEIGYLAASLVDDPRDSASQYLKWMREERGAFVEKDINGIRILEGGIGSGCTITSRELYERVGGFPEKRGARYWHLSEWYQRKLRAMGYRAAYLEGFEVWHAGGRLYSTPQASKAEYHRRAEKARERKDLVKRMILGLPLASRLNDRFRWFDPPGPEYVPPAHLLQPEDEHRAT